MKTKLHFIMLCVILVTFLFGCGQAKKDMQQHKELNLYDTFTSLSGNFTIQTPIEYAVSESVNIYQDAIFLENISNDSFIDVFKYAKIDISKSMNTFAQDFMNKVTADEQLKNLAFIPMTIANTSGYGVSKDYTSDKQLFTFTAFIYEDGEFYKLITISSPSTKAKEHDSQIQNIMDSWKDLSVTNAISLNQTVNLSDIGMTITIPENWNLSENSTTEQPLYRDYISPDRTSYISIHTKHIEEGYTLDFPGYVDDRIKTLQTSGAISQEVTIGSHTGYLIESSESSQELFTNTIYNYLIYEDNQLIDVYISIRNSRNEQFKPYLTTLIESLQNSH